MALYFIIDLFIGTGFMVKLYERQVFYNAVVGPGLDRNDSWLLVRLIFL